MNRVLHVSQPAAPWIAVRWVVLLSTGALVGALWVVPDHALRVVWYVVVPVLPATFLINVELWRNICPIATLNTLSGNRIGSRRLSKNGARWAGLVAVGLLAVLIPARRILLNVDASATGTTIIVCGAFALLGGFFFERKSGFCTSICPVLPVERLYGQRPLFAVSNARCTPCAACSKVCVDLLPTKSAELLVSGRGSARLWTTTLFGGFAAAFPGLILAYFMMPETAPGDPMSAYAVTAFCSALSWIVLSSLFQLGNVSAATGLIWCAAIAAGLYYWYTPASIASAFGLPVGIVWALRITLLSLVGVWLMRGLRPLLRKRQVAQNRQVV